jgi:hypothetical protein
VKVKPDQENAASQSLQRDLDRPLLCPRVFGFSASHS